MYNNSVRYNFLKLSNYYRNYLVLVKYEFWILREYIDYFINNEEGNVLFQKCTMRY